VQGKYNPKDNNESEEMYKTGLNKMYSEWSEGRDLIEWMRDYNKLHGNVLHYYGSDIGGFYNDWKSSMNRIVNYLERVDAVFANKLSDQFRPYSEAMSKNARVKYSERLTSLERARLEIIFDEALEAFDSKKEKYIALWNWGEFSWAR
jgi:erythromycin esterase-like protein